MTNTFPSGSLCARTQQLVIDRPRHVTYEDLANKAKVTRRWVEAFATGKVRDPSCPKVERLYVVLTGKPIFED